MQLYNPEQPVVVGERKIYEQRDRHGSDPWGSVYALGAVVP